ncbi:hypothetical protein EV13_2120 [Prochlorococcus sp. MIT 0702]|nr:hypothetical protein EV13_2120 [Prochlorococcus sp. MIT 0702]
MWEVLSDVIIVLSVNRIPRPLTLACSPSQAKHHDTSPNWGDLHQ